MNSAEINPAKYAAHLTFAQTPSCPEFPNNFQLFQVHFGAIDFSVTSTQKILRAMEKSGCCEYLGDQTAATNNHRPCTQITKS